MNPSLCPICQSSLTISKEENLSNILNEEVLHFKCDNNCYSLLKGAILFNEKTYIDKYQIYSYKDAYQSLHSTIYFYKKNLYFFSNYSSLQTAYIPVANLNRDIILNKIKLYLLLS